MTFFFDTFVYSFEGYSSLGSLGVLAANGVSGDGLGLFLGDWKRDLGEEVDVDAIRVLLRFL